MENNREEKKNGEKSHIYLWVKICEGCVYAVYADRRSSLKRISEFGEYVLHGTYSGKMLRVHGGK